jgi:hypothetical protein
MACLYVHPKIDTAGFELVGRRFGASDGDDAIDLAISELLSGRYPYYARTFLDNPITPMPGTLMLAFPFYLLGASIVQNVFWLAVFFLAIALYYRDAVAAAVLACCLYLLSPNVVYHILVGGDYIANSISILVFASLLFESSRRGAAVWQGALWAVLLGVAISSRLSFLPLAPLVLVALAKASSWSRAFTLSALVLASSSAVTLPAFLHDPGGFSPLHTASKLDVVGAFPWAPYAVPLAGFGLSAMLAARRRRYSLPELMRDALLVEAALVVSGLVLASVSLGRVHLDFPHFGILFMFFGLFAFAPARADTIRTAVASPLSSLRPHPADHPYHSAAS